MSAAKEKKHEFTKLFDELIERNSRIAELEEALLFYASERNYIRTNIGYATMSQVDLDRGNRARKVLEGNNDDDQHD